MEFAQAPEACTLNGLYFTVQALSYFSWVTWIRPENTSEFRGPFRLIAFTDNLYS